MRNLTLSVTLIVLTAVIWTVNRYWNPSSENFQNSMAEKPENLTPSTIAAETTAAETSGSDHATVSVKMDDPVPASAKKLFKLIQHTLTQQEPASADQMDLSAMNNEHLQQQIHNLDQALSELEFQLQKKSIEVPDPQFISTKTENEFAGSAQQLFDDTKAADIQARLQRMKEHLSETP